MKNNIRLDIKEIIIIVLTVLLIVFAWIAFKPSVIDTGKELRNSEIERLTNENDGIKKDILTISNRIKKTESKVDSLESLKPIIKTKYKAIYEKINNSNATELTNKFKDVFTGAGIK